jgi:trimethylamine corrinoid protein
MYDIDLAEMKRSVVEGDVVHAQQLARSALQKKIDPARVLDEGFIPGIREVGRLWEEGEYFLPDLMRGADALKAVMGILNPAIESGAKKQVVAGRIVIGTVEGDIHDIGKNLVSSMFIAHGYQVEDLGADVPTARFIQAAEDTGADIICLSALLTTTMVNQKKLIDELIRRKLRSSYRVIIGGSPATMEWSREIGADGYGGNALEGVKIATNLLHHIQ